MVSRDSVGGHMLAGMLTTAAGFGASCMLLLPLSTSFGLLSVVAIVLVYLASLFLLAVLLVGGWIHRQQ
jgi:predicted RND superfamily exporter protein